MVEVRIGDGEVEILSYEEFEARVASGRIPADAWVRFEPVTGEEFVLAGGLDLFDSLRQDAAVAWRSRFTNAGPPVLTALLVGVQIRIWMYTMVPGFGSDLAYGWMNWLPPAMEDRQTYRLVMSGLLHTDFLHILLNLVWLAYTGWNIERALGRLNLATIFFFSVFVGAMASMFMTPNVPSLGASGGVYGLVSASVVFGLVRQELLPERGRRLFGFAMLPYLVLMFWGGMMNENTDNWAHFGGLVCGGLLAFVLDPPPFQRRPRQNAFIQIGGTVIAVGTMGVLAVGGPRLYPLIDKDSAYIASLPRGSRARVLPPDEMLLEEFTWDVPSGWRPGSNAAGDSAFESPSMGRRRSWAVVQFDRDRPISVDELVDEWVEKLRRGNSEAVIEPVDATPWQGAPAERVRRLRIQLPTGDEPVVLDFIATTRGMYGLYRVSEVEARDEDRLAPLFARLDSRVQWREPLVLQGARRNAGATSRSLKARSALALELARWGEPEEALAIQEQLVAERPDDPARWTPWIRMAGWYPDRLDADALYARALHEIPVPEVVVAVAAALRESGRNTDADALLQLAWVREPGDRKIRRALRKAGLPWRLDDRGIPTELALTPAGEPRPVEEIGSIEALPLTLDAANRWYRVTTADRAQLARRFAQAMEESGPSEAVPLLLRLRDGTVDPEPGEARVLRKSLLAVGGDRPTVWMPPELVGVLQQDGMVDRLLGFIELETEAGE